jgi:hypothetical protein
MEFYSAMKKNEILSFTSKWMELETKYRMFSLIEIKGKYSKVIGLWSHDKVRAHKGGMS